MNVKICLRGMDSKMLRQFLIWLVSMNFGIGNAFLAATEKKPRLAPISKTVETSH